MKKTLLVLSLLGLALSFSGCKKDDNKVSSVSENVPSITESSVTNNSSSTSSQSEEQEETLLDIKNKSKEILTREYNTYSSSNYLTSDWAKLTKAYNDGLSSIDSASTFEEVYRIKNLTLSAMTLTPIAEESNVQHILSGAHTGYSVKANDEEGKSITISHNEKLSSWGNFLTNGNFTLNGEFKVTTPLDNLDTDNAFKFKIKNVGTTTINFALNFAKGDFKTIVGESGVILVEPNKEVEKVISFSAKPEVIILFFDCCDQNSLNDTGSIELSSYSFFHEEVQPVSYEFINDNNVYQINEKEGCVTNITYTDIPGSSYSRVVCDMPKAKENAFYKITFKNNASHSTRVKIHVGYWGDPDNDGVYTWIGLLNNYSYKNGNEDVHGEGYELTIEANETKSFDTIIDEDTILNTYYTNGYQRIISQIFFEIDCSYWEEGKANLNYSGDLDIVSIEQMGGN